MSHQYDLSFLRTENQSVYRKLTTQHYGCNRPLGITAYEQAVLLPTTDLRYNGGVVDKEGQYITNSAWNNEFDTSLYSYAFSETEDVVYRDEEVLYLGILCGIWGHALVDNFKKAWALYHEDGKDRKVVYLTAPNQELPSYVFDLFRLADIDLYRCERIDKITRFKKVVIPDYCVDTYPDAKIYYPEFEDIRQRIVNNALSLPPCAYEKVYFTRTKVKRNRPEYGEKSIERLFRRQGYEIISPETLTVAQQVNILQHCKYFAATEGSVSHSSLFCNKDCHVILIRKCEYLNPYTQMINDMISYRVTFIDSNRSIYNHNTDLWRGPFYLYPSPQLRRFLGLAPLSIPAWLRLSFLYYAWHHSRWGIWISERIWKIRQSLSI